MSVNKNNHDFNKLREKNMHKQPKNPSDISKKVKFRELSDKEEEKIISNIFNVVSGMNKGSKVNGK